MWVKILWIPTFAGMTEKTSGLDKSSPYICIDKQARHLTYGLEA
jgi:hypothetical protein